MSKEIELNESMSSEEIAAYADAVAQEVEIERQGDTMSDAQIINDVASIEKPSAEEKSSSESAKAKSQSEDAGKESATQSWVDDDAKAEVAAYGISESDLSDFASREELDRALRLLEKTALEVGRKATVETESEKARNEKGQFVKNEESNQEKPETESRKGSRYEISLSKDEYDDKLVDELERLRDHYESRLSALEGHIVQESAKAEEQQFDSFVDSLGHADLFGKTGEETEAELKRRDDLFVAVKAQVLGLERIGRPTKQSQQLVKRVADMVFADELNKKRLKQQTQKISKQSQLRQGGSPTKPLPPSTNPRDEFDRLYQELDRAK